ncbi:MAG: hypothetical protein KCHDKBKB_00472 [Elusimicrobia bacterium]|nr:hypothetical protein [Elusimicrobiota bacterium]
MSNMKILDLGCGARKTEGAIGLDQIPLPGVDVVHNLDVYPYPLESHQFDRIVIRHVAEHVEDVVKLMEEVHRLGKSGATIEIHVPHYTSANAYIDPTHKHHFSLLAFDFFCGGTQHGYILKTKFKMLRRHLEFWSLHDKISLVPAHFLGVRCFATKHPVFFERFLAFFFPLREFQVFLEVEK